MFFQKGSILSIVVYKLLFHVVEAYFPRKYGELKKSGESFGSFVKKTVTLQSKLPK